MLPPTLVSIYRQYKEDTDAVASWLASNAKAAGCPADLLAAPVKQNNKSPSKPASAKYVVPLQSFIPLAEHILASKRAASVPASLLKTLDRTSAASEAKHSFFNRVLIKVRDILSPEMPAAAAPSAPADADADAVDSAGTLPPAMEALDMAEPSSDLLAAPDVERPTAANNDVDMYEAEQQTSLEDAALAFIMMLEDLNRIRAYIKWIWSNQFDLAAAAVATNTGLDLARHLMSDVLPLLETHGGAWNMTHKSYIAGCVQKGFGVDSLQSDNGMLNQDTYDVADSVLMIPFFFLRSFLDVLQPRAVPLIKEGIFGYYEPTRDRSTMSNQEKFREDQVLLMETFTELTVIIRMIPDYPVRDEFLRGIDEMDRTRAIPYYLVFAAQIFLDSNHQLRDKASAYCQNMLQQLSSMSASLETHLKFHENLKIDHWPASNDRALVATQGQIKWIQSDPVFVAKQKQYSGQGMPVPITMQPQRLLMRSPVLAGLVLFHFRAKMYDVGISVVNAWGSISYSNHLYNALRREGLLQGRWEDMDVVSTALGDASFFVGEPPYSRNAYLTRFCLQMGVSAAALRIKPGAPVSSMFDERYLGGTEQLEWTPERVDQVLSRAEYEVEGSVEDGNLALSQIDDPDKLREIRRAQQGKARRAGAKTGSDKARLAPEKLVQSLILALQAETLEHAFPYLLLHRFSWRLLRSVKDNCDPLLRSLHSPAYMERESELPFVVGYIFLAAAGIEYGTLPDDRLLHKAADAMNGMIEAGAGRFTQGFLQSIAGIRVQFEDKVEEEAETEKL
ncbi:hypothetical protein HRG_003526 [Hirsutella rhossiliensis]|uniref:DUF6604 domain-containing protein n=1 Tax=Hirsutella rhossiliensis TaxID=111463 RepID=A0A9P8SL69_9HYPO|nr:uncharacterized protein HRG_03526 [Hirsutella rhossiliensis]KAH0965510.1 hypothetical protein HRG_03526 [Hirsutella rhossiliensis]